MSVEVRTYQMHGETVVLDEPESVFEVISSGEPAPNEQLGSELANFIGYWIKDTNCIIDGTATWYKPPNPELLIVQEEPVVPSSDQKTTDSE